MKVVKKNTIFVRLFSIISCIEIVKCEPSPVVDINNTNVEIDFLPMYFLFFLFTVGKKSQMHPTKKLPPAKNQLPKAISREKVIPLQEDSLRPNTRAIGNEGWLITKTFAVFVQTNTKRIRWLHSWKLSSLFFSSINKIEYGIKDKTYNKKGKTKHNFLQQLHIIPAVTNLLVL